MPPGHFWKLDSLRLKEFESDLGTYYIGECLVLGDLELEFIK